jgi:serine/threonine-protein kinase 24/25/MST4
VDFICFDIIQSFKEMITMCLMKDPKHRPTAKMLMKHSFFKHALPTKNFARTIQALPLRWQRFNLLKAGSVFPAILLVG